MRTGERRCCLVGPCRQVSMAWLSFSLSALRFVSAQFASVGDVPSEWGEDLTQRKLCFNSYAIAAMASVAKI